MNVTESLTVYDRGPEFGGWTLRYNGMKITFLFDIII